MHTRNFFFSPQGGRTYIKNQAVRSYLCSQGN
nr:unnamed protein product [Callosobruchus chinensis]